MGRCSGRSLRALRACHPQVADRHARGGLGCRALARRVPSAGASPRAGDRRPVRHRDGRAARSAAVARSWTLATAGAPRAAARRRASGRHRSDSASSRDRAAAVSLPARRRTRPAPDPGRSGPCRNHRARPLSLHGERRDGSAPRRASRLHPQGHRKAHGRSGSRASLAHRGAALGRQHGRLLVGVRAGGGGCARFRRCAPAPGPSATAS